MALSKAIVNRMRSEFQTGESMTGDQFVEDEALKILRGFKGIPESGIESFILLS
jgi:hypothetical protein